MLDGGDDHNRSQAAVAVYCMFLCTCIIQMLRCFRGCIAVDLFVWRGSGMTVAVMFFKALASCKCRTFVFCIVDHYVFTTLRSNPNPNMVIHLMCCHSYSGTLRITECGQGVSTDHSLLEVYLQ